MSRLLLLFILLGTSAASSADPPVTAVLSSNSPYYEKAYTAFREAYAGEVTRRMHGEKIPANPKTVVAFGGKAGSAAYPGAERVILCLAPGATVTLGDNRIRIAMVPAPEEFIEAIVRLVPGLKTLGVLRSQEERGALQIEGNGSKVTLAVETVRSPNDLPRALRSLMSQPLDALWLPPDPALVTKNNFAIIAAAAKGNGFLLVAPSSGLVGRGAHAAVVVTPESAGKAAAMAALQWEDPETLYYPKAIMVRGK